MLFMHFIGGSETQESCSRALRVVQSVRDRLRGGQGDALHEYQKSFAPYSDGKKRKKGFSNISAPKRAKLNRWSTTFICLASKDAYQVPGTVAEKETLVEAGLGEVKVEIPNVECSTQEFYGILTSTFPKLQGVGSTIAMYCQHQNARAHLSECTIWSNHFQQLI